MFQKIENRLIILIGIILLYYTASVVYIRVKENDFVKSVSTENNITFRKSIITQLTDLGFKTTSTSNIPNSKNNVNELSPTQSEVIIRAQKPPIDIDSLKNIIAKNLLAQVTFTSKDEIKLRSRNINDIPYISYVFLIVENSINDNPQILLIQRESETLKLKQTELKEDNLTLVLLFLVFALILTAGLFLQVVRPVSTIITSFIKNTPERLNKLRNTKSEFGVFANLIKEFFDQKKILEEEIKVRKITQEELETLNDELEKRVEDRTEELAVTNIELQKERDQTKQYLDIAGTIIALIDRDGYIQLLNKKGDEALGYQPDELIGKNWYDTCIEENSRANYKKMHLDILSGKVLPIEFLIGDVITKGKEVRTFIFHKTVVKDSKGEFSGLLFSAEDITELKQKEKELIEAKEKADESNRLKSTFLANMSHELRTPMIGILGYSDLLMNELKVESHKKMATAIHDSGQRLIDTLNLILDLSRLEANKHNIDYQIVNINALLKNVTFHFEAAAGKKKLFLKTSVPSFDVIARTDPRMIRDVINNLINNAIKFTNEGGVFITLEVFHRDFLISIKDTGIGIPLERIDIIFEEFRQVSEGLGRGFQGTGLGLTICKKYVELLGGQISVKSTPNQGSEFKFQIPMITDDSVKGKENENHKQIDTVPNKIYENDDRSVKHRILIVEDDATSRDVINLFLKNIYQITFAQDGETAVLLAKENKFDLILLDINLGSGITGLQVMEQIRSFDFYKKTPIIAATAFAMLGDREKFLNSGFNHYISKPYLKQQLLKLVADSLRTSKN